MANLISIPILIWLILVVIGVSDAREYRIPNYLILTALGMTSVFLVLEQFNGYGYRNITTHLYGFLITFVVGLVFYLLKFMAAGDVKLAAVIGFILGHGAILIWAKYFAFTCFFIGSMYWMLNRLQMQTMSINTSKPAKGFNLINYLWIEGGQIKSDFKQRRNLTYMPFAPVLIISLAMQQYFQY